MGGAAQKAGTKALRARRYRRLRLAWCDFIGSTKATLRRVLGEKRVVLTAEAQARLDALPDMFMDFIAAPERFFARPVAEAA